MHLHPNQEARKQEAAEEKAPKKRRLVIHDDQPYDLAARSEALEDRLEARYDHDEAKLEKMRKLFVTITVIGMAASLALAFYGWKMGVFTDREILANLLKAAGFWAPILFVLLQIIQCVIPIIPGGVTIFVGVYLFGPFQGFLLNYVGIYIGEVLCFLLARMLGTAFVRTVVSKENYAKYSKWLEKNQKALDKLFIITMALPGMPDDIICLFMGLSRMSFRFFAFHLSWTKLPAILGYSLFLGWLKDKTGGLIDWFRQVLLVD